VSPTTAVALGAGGVLAVGWLCVVFMQPSRGRATIEWLATISMYVALVAWFLGLSLGAREEGRTLLLIPFGTLLVLFSLGLLVSIGKLLAHLVGRSGDSASATN
jgi:hypothetical protein